MKTLPFFFNQCLDKKRLKKMILWSLSFQGEHKTLQMIENLKTLGFQYATSAGVSLSIDDLTIPTKKRAEVLESEAAILRSVQGRAKGNRTAIEEIQTVIDTWHRTSETVKEHVIDFFEATDVLNPVYMMAFSGARGNVSQVRQLVGMRGLMADPKGDIIGYAIRSNFREGLTITEYMISAYGARKGVVDTALRTADAGYLTRRLVDVAQHIIVQQGSCGTKKGILLGPIRDGGKIVLRVEDRLLGRVLARDISIHGHKIAARNEAIDEELAYEIAQALRSQSNMAALEKSKVRKDSQEAKIFVRSPLTCDLRNGVCQLCYGWSFTQNRMVPIGEAVGVIAGQSIGEPGTQLTMRTFHTGGVFTGEVQGQFRAPHGGSIHYPKAFPGVLVRTPYGQIAFLVKEAGTLIIHDEVNNRHTELDVPSHSALFLREGEKVYRRQILALPGGLDSGGNDKVETRKIVFSDFDGEVIYENVSRKKTRFPEEMSVLVKRILEKKDQEERKAMGKKPRKQRKLRLAKVFVGEKRVNKYKNKEWYTLTARVGTLWILAGRKLDPFYKTLPIFHNSGHLVEPNTLLSRQALLSHEEGFICHEKRSSISKDHTIVQLPPSSTYQLDQEIDENALVTTIEASDTFAADQAWIYQPRLYTTYATLRFDILKNTLTVRNQQGHVFVIPDYTQQIGDQERRHLIDYRDYGQQSMLKTVLYPWRTTLGWSQETASEHTRHLELIYYQSDHQIHDAAVFVWQKDLFRHPSHRHGQLFLTPYKICPIKATRIDFDHLQQGWACRTNIDTDIVDSFQPAKTIKMQWVDEGDILYGQPNLQNQPCPMKATKAGLCTIRQKEPITVVPVSPQFTVIESRSDDRPAEEHKGQRNPREKERGSWRIMGEIPFPFDQEEKGRQESQAEKTVIEHSPGWLYLPNQKGLRSGLGRHSFVSSLPQFHGQPVATKPLFMAMESRRVPAQQTTVESLYMKVMATVTNSMAPSFTRLEGAQAVLPSIRLISLLRHPRLVPFLEKGTKDIQASISHFTILSHVKNPFYTLFGHNSERLMIRTGRLACELPQAEKFIKAEKPSKTRKTGAVRKTRKSPINQSHFDYALYPLQGVVNLTFSGKTLTPPPPTTVVSSQANAGYAHFLSFGLLYQRIREFSLDRISRTTKKLTDSYNFEINPVVKYHNVSTPIVMGEITTQTTIYTAFQSVYCELKTDLPQIEVKETATYTIWSKQRPSRLVPNERPKVASVLPCILPAGSYLQEHDFMCRFLLRFKPIVDKKEDGGSWKLTWNPPWQPQTSMVATQSTTTSTITISFVKRPYFHTKDDEIFHPSGTWLVYGDIFSRRRSYMQAHGEVIRTSSNNCFILEEKDTQSFTLKDPMSKGLTAIGAILRFGEEVQPGVGTPISGQIIAFTPTTITLRKAQPILFYDSGSIHVKDGQSITKGHPLVTLSYQRLITGDIVQGIPKVEQLFEGSQAKDKETEMKLSDILTMTFNGLRITKGLSNQEAFEKSIRMIQHKIIENIQKVYLSQGVSIADIHFEVIVRRMTSWGKIRDVGNSGLFRDEIMPIQRIERVNGGIFGPKAQYEPVIVGISTSASNAESFLSAASFQETSRVLTRDAIEGKTDFLRGVKERVILGDLVPTGTGFIEHAAYIANPPKPW